MDSKGIVFALEQERMKTGMSIAKWADYISVPLSSYNGWIYGYRKPALCSVVTAMENAGLELIVRRKV